MVTPIGTYLAMIKTDAALDRLYRSLNQAAGDGDANPVVTDNYDGASSKVLSNPWKVGLDF